MLRREFFLSFVTFALIFIFQESILNQLNLPLGGFSLIIIAALIWSSISEPENAAIVGFIAGIFLDLQPSNAGPFGHWTLVMIITCYSISFLGYGDDAINANPVGLLIMTSVAVLCTLLLYILIGLIFGLNLGTSFQLMKDVIGISLWSALVAPIIVPLMARAHDQIYTSKK